MARVAVSSAPKPRIAVGLLCAAMLCGCGGGSSSPGGSVWTLNPRTAAVEGQTKVPGHPCALIAGPDGIWTTDLDLGALYRIDPQVRLVVKLHGERPCGVAVGRAIWVG